MLIALFATTGAHIGAIWVFLIEASLSNCAEVMLTFFVAVKQHITGALPWDMNTVLRLFLFCSCSCRGDHHVCLVHPY